MSAELDLQAAKANYQVLKADLERDLLAQESAAAGVEADAAQAAMDAAANDAMATQGLIGTHGEAVPAARRHGSEETEDGRSAADE